MNILLETVLNKNKHWATKGTVVSYIPELRKANLLDVGVAIYTTNGELYSAGAVNTKFTIQSISKILTLMLAICDNGKEFVFSKVGVDPTSDDFNSIANLENKNERRPLNPMINSGAIAIASMIKGATNEIVTNRILEFIRKITGNDKIEINQDVYKSEKDTGNKNRSLAYFLKDSGIIEGDVEDIVDIYFKQCSIEVTCVDIAKIGAVIANEGTSIITGEKIFSKENAKIVKTIMLTCGLYNGSGEFAVNVGIPAKSGVGGGILATVPKRMGIGTYAPSLDKKGNSLPGIKILGDLSHELDLSIF